jgi:hypothetical protein
MKKDKSYGEIRRDVIVDHLNKIKIDDNIKKIINEYFSDEMQTDETPMGALKRNQIVKQLLDFARA